MLPYGKEQIARLEAELAEARTRTETITQAYNKLVQALADIDYVLVNAPNYMECSGYAVHVDESMVVTYAAQRMKELAEAKKMPESVRELLDLFGKKKNDAFSVTGQQIAEKIVAVERHYEEQS